MNEWGMSIVDSKTNRSKTLVTNHKFQIIFDKYCWQEIVLPINTDYF